MSDGLRRTQIGIGHTHATKTVVPEARTRFGCTWRTSGKEIIDNG